MPVVNYLWDDVEDNIIEEYDDEGNTLAEYDTEPTLYGNITSQHRDGQISVFHHDGIGNTIAVTDENADVTDTRAYSAFGEITESTGSTEFPFQFVGQKGYYRDEETGDYSVRARPYEPKIGRWKTVDPLGFSQGVNHWTYAANSPMNYFDPSGLTLIVSGNPACDVEVLESHLQAVCWYRMHRAGRLNRMVELYRRFGVGFPFQVENGEARIVMPCPSGRPRDCCGWLVENPWGGRTIANTLGIELSGWALQRRTVIERECEGGGGPMVGGVGGILCKPTVSPAEGTVILIIGLVTVLVITNEETQIIETIEELLPRPRLDPRQPVDPPPPPPRGSRSCATEYAGWDECWRYTYDSFGQAKNDAFGRNASARQKPADQCGDGGGTHYSIWQSGQFVGSIICCNCCEDTPTGPVLDNKCNAQ